MAFDFFWPIQLHLSDKAYSNTILVLCLVVIGNYLFAVLVVSQLYVVLLWSKMQDIRFCLCLALMTMKFSLDYRL